MVHRADARLPERLPRLRHRPSRRQDARQSHLHRRDVRLSGRRVRRRHGRHWPRDDGELLVVVLRASTSAPRAATTSTSTTSSCGRTWGSASSLGRPPSRGPGGGAAASSTQFVVVAGLHGHLERARTRTSSWPETCASSPSRRSRSACTRWPASTSGLEAMYNASSPPASFTPPPLRRPAAPARPRVDHGRRRARLGDRRGLRASSSSKRGRVARVGGAGRSVVRIVLAEPSRDRASSSRGPDSPAYVVTAQHVVDSGEPILVERTVDGPGGSHWTEAYPDAEVVAFDADADLAVIRLNGVSADHFTPLPLAAAARRPTRPSSRTASPRAASRRGRAWCPSPARCSAS